MPPHRNSEKHRSAIVLSAWVVLEVSVLAIPLHFLKRKVQNFSPSR